MAVAIEVKLSSYSTKEQGKGMYSKEMAEKWLNERKADVGK